MLSKTAKRSILLTTCDFMFFSFKSSPCKNLLLQQFFISDDHVEQCSMFAQELLENTNREIADITGQFYGWLCLHIPHSEALANASDKTGIKNFPMRVSDTTMNPFFK